LIFRAAARDFFSAMRGARKDAVYLRVGGWTTDDRVPDRQTEERYITNRDPVAFFAGSRRQEILRTELS